MRPLPPQHDSAPADSTATRGVFRRITPILAVVLIFFAAFGVRFIHLGQASFWQDEIAQLARTTLSLLEVWEQSPPDKPPLDYFVQALLVGAQPDERHARLHACLFGAGFVAAMGYWGWRAGGFSLGSIATLLSLALPIQVRYSQEGRPYALMLLAGTIFLIALFGERRTGRWTRGSWARFTVASALCVWSHYLLIAPCIAAGLIAVGSRWGRSRRPDAARADEAGSPSAGGKFIAGCVLVFALSILPLGGRAWGALERQLDWSSSEEGRLAFNPAEVTRYMDAFAWGYEPVSSVPHAGWALGALMGLGLAGAWRTERRTAALGCAAAFVVSFGGTLLLFFAFDRWIKIRYVLAALPPAVFLAAIGLDTLSRAAARLIGGRNGARIAGGAGVLMAGAVFVSQFRYVITHPVQRDDWRGVVERVRERAEPDSLLLVTDWHSISVVGYYLRLLGVEVPLRGIYFDAARLEAELARDRDVWVFGTHQDWWNIDRTVVSGFLNRFAELPQELPEFWGVDVRRNRDAVALARDRSLESLTPLLKKKPEVSLLDGAAGSPWLGGGWMTARPWASTLYQRNLMASRAQILIPLDEPESVVLTLRMRTQGGTRDPWPVLRAVIAGEPVAEGSVGQDWTDIALAIPCERLAAGLNVLELEASEPLRIPPAEAGDQSTSISFEVQSILLRAGMD